MLRFFVIVVGGAVLLGGSASADDRCDLVRQAVATYGYAAARQHALENYGQEAVAFGDKCLGKSGVVETTAPEPTQVPYHHAGDQHRDNPDDRNNGPTDRRALAPHRRPHHRGAVARSDMPDFASGPPPR